MEQAGRLAVLIDSVFLAPPPQRRNRKITEESWVILRVVLGLEFAHSITVLLYGTLQGHLKLLFGVVFGVNRPLRPEERGKRFRR